MGKRRLARETALQALYLVDVSHLSPEDAFESIAHGHQSLDDQSAEFARGLVHGTRTHLPEIDKEIQAIASNWELGRMAAVDRNLIRMAAYELMQTETPPKVIIDEALEISKRYSSENSSKFINGILDKIKSPKKH